MEKGKRLRGSRIDRFGFVACLEFLRFKGKQSGKIPFHQTQKEAL